MIFRAMVFSYASSGWRVRFASESVEERWANTERKVVISAHTTPFLDGIHLHFALDRLETPHVIYARGLGCLCPSWCREIEPGGFVSGEVRALRSKASFCRGVFPSGGAVAWKSGFYHIARQTGAGVFVFGIDYGRRRVVVDSFFDPRRMTAADVRDRAIDRLRAYGPGPVCVPMRVLFGYGDVVHDVASWKLRCVRVGIFVAAVWWWWWWRTPK